MWSIVTPQKWSALAPEFAEVEENVEYDEREDEFDIHPIEEIHKRRLDLEDEKIDALTIDPIKGGYEHDAFHMPVLLDLDASDSEEDIVAIGPGTMRRKGPAESKDWTDGQDAGDSSADRSSRQKDSGRTTTKSRRR